MLSAIGGNSSLQMISALNAFKEAGATNNNKVETQSLFDMNTSRGINLSDNNNLLENIDLSEVRNCAQQIGETDLTDEDIKYGLTYGRSVIADYIA